MKTVVYIYQYNELNNGHSIFDKRMGAALSELYNKDNFISLAYDVSTNSFKGDTNKTQIDNENSIIILSHFNVFKIAGWFKKSKVVFLNHDLPYYAYWLQKDYKGLIKAAYSWLYIRYYLRFASFVFFISKTEMKKSGVPANISEHIRVGVRPGGNLQNFPCLLPVALFTGNYKWSLKAKSLRKVFKNKYTGQLLLNAVNVDDTFSNINTLTGNDIFYFNDYPAAKGIRLGVITDDFLSGFKLKALELIHAGCCLVSFSDITPEFDDIIHADLFINIIQDLDEIDNIYNNLMQVPDVIAKYKLFYDDVCTQFNWDKTANQIKETLAKI